MRKLCIFIGTTLGGYAGWEIAERFGGEFVACFFVSGIGSILGVYAGWKAAAKIEE